MKVELSLHATKLKNVAGALRGTSDPFAVVTQVATAPGETAKVLGKTEVIKNTLNPQWVTCFETDYELGTPLKVAISLFDEVKKGDNKSMGSAVFEIGELLGARGNTKAKKLKNGGTLYANVRKAQGSGSLSLQLKGIKLKNVEGMFGKSDPFFEVARKINAAGGLTWDNVYRSQMQKNNLNPEWSAATIPLSQLCGGDLDLPLQISVFDYESKGNHTPMGRVETSVNGLVTAACSGNTQLNLTNKGKDVGSLSVLKAQVSGIIDQAMQNLSIDESPPPPVAPAGAAGGGAFVPAVAVGAGAAAGGGHNFVDYVSGGCEFNAVVAIDFTGSNGDPRKPGTLHYLGNPSGVRNDYEKAIAAILSVLAQYDSDQQFPVLGFGAKYGGVVQHCFQCGPTPQAAGVQGVLDAYHATFKSGLIMSGPTVITEIIQFAAAKANQSQQEAAQQGKQAYTILLIVTDGAVSDVQATAQVLAQVSDAPLSIVIVGVGTADFSSMQFLDDFAEQQHPNNARDMTQFVEFNKHCATSTALTSETLHEIPAQVTGYFGSKGIAPLPAISRTDSEIMIEPEDEEIDLSLSFRPDEEIVVRSGGDGFVDGFAANR